MSDKYTILYCRVSTDEQSGENKMSLPDQERKLANYSKNQGYGNLKVFREDCSGFKFDRPALNEIRDLIKHNQVSAVMFTRIDRIAREQAILDQLRKNYFIPYNIEVHSIEDLGTLKWDMYSIHIQDNMVNFANLWGKILVKVMQDGLKAKIRKGSVMCFKHPPYGYSVFRNSETDLFELIPEETEAYWVRRIFYWYVYERMGSSQIRNQLDELNAPTPSQRGYRIAKKSLPGWSEKSIMGIIKNETYMGVWRYGKNSKNPEFDDLPPVIVPKIIAPELFKQAQEQRKKNTQRRRKISKHEYLLSGQIKCGCKLALVGSPAKRTYKDKTYLYLRYRHNYSKTTCKHVFRADGPDGIDAAVWQYIESLLRDINLLERSVKKYLADEESRRIPMLARLQSVETAIREKDKELDRLTDAYQSGIIELDVFATRKQAINESKASYERQKQELSEAMHREHDLDELTKIIALVNDLQDEIDHFDFTLKRKILAALNTQVTVEKIDHCAKVRILCILGDFSCFLGGKLSKPDPA